MNKTHIPRITLYSGPSCPYCRQARLFLKTHKVPFLELDVQRSPKARKQLERMGARGIPVILVGDERMDGFQPARLKQLLRNAGIRI